MVNPEKPPVDLGYNTSVPTADVATNDYSSQVLGSKDDTTAGTSLVSLTKLIDSIVDDIKTYIGNPSAQTLTTITAKLGDLSVALPAILESFTATEAGTLSERLAYIQQFIGKGSGTAIGANTSLVDKIDVVLAAVQAVQNNTSFTAAVPVEMNKPAADNRAYRIACNVYDEVGNMEDPDDSEVCVRVIQTAGTYVTATLYKEAALSTALDNPTDNTAFPNASGWRAMERDAAGRYFFFYKVASDATEEHLVVEFGWSEAETLKFQVRSTEIADEHDDASDTLSVVTSINTNVGDPSGDTLTSLTAKLGDSANAVAPTLDTVNANVGDPSGDTLTTITAKLGDSDVAIAPTVKTIDGYHDVPVEDAATDATIRDVVGKKSDTVAGSSIVSLIKIADAAVDVIDGYHDVPVEDAATDTTIRDVVGKKSDTVAGSSIVSLVKIADAAVDVIDGLHDVPASADVATNANIRDVVGRKDDSTSGSSIVSLVKIVDALHDVPVEDAATDTVMRDVVGKKSDTAAGTSLVAIGKQIKALHNVPVEDAATDTNLRDVVGKKSDTTSGTSIVSIGKQIKAKTDLFNAAVDAGDATHAITVAHDVNETQVLEVANTGIFAWSLFFDLDVLVTAGEGTAVTVRVYNKMDGTNYSDKAIAVKVFTIASSTEYPYVEFGMLHGNCKATIQLGSAVTETRTIAYRSITRDLGA